MKDLQEPGKELGEIWGNISGHLRALFGDRYDWTTRVPDNGNEWRKFRVVPRSHPMCPLVLYFV